MKQSIKNLLVTSPYRQIIIFILPATMLLLVIGLSFIQNDSQQFTDLAFAFIHGHLNFLSPIGGLTQDPVFYHGRIFWTDEPFPALILIPFVAFFNIFHIFFYQGYVEWLLVIGILYFVFNLARKLTYSIEDSLILVFGFALGSVFIGIASLSSSWYFAQVITTFLLFWSLYEFYNRKRWWLISLICGCILLTRPSASPIIVFFAIELWLGKKVNLSQKIKNQVKLFIPVVGATILIALYNYLRFQSPFNGGNEYQLISTASAESRASGIFSLSHIPTNLYSLFLRSPNPILKTSNTWMLKEPYIQDDNLGISVFITSPYFLYLFSKKWSLFDSRSRHLLVAILISMFMVLSYYGIGNRQYGTRYSLDFLPEVFLLFMILYKKEHDRLSNGIKFLMYGASLLNFFLVWSFIL